MAIRALPEGLPELETPVYGPYAYTRTLLRPGMDVLDVGCGNAKVSAYLAQSGAAVDGIEPTPDRADTASLRLRYVSRVPAGEPDPGLKAAYDVITFFDVVEHLPEPGPVLAWAASRLPLRGLLIASIPNAAHLSFRLKVLRGDWSMHDWGLFDRTHLRFFDPKTMLQLQPSGTELVTQRFYAPDADAGLRAITLKRLPNLFALHALVIWRRLG